MSFNDDSQILSNLGILDSHEKSPKRETVPEKFVDVRLTSNKSDSEDDDDESDTIFDRNVLLSSTRRQNGGMLRGRADNQTIRYFLMCMLFLMAGMVSTSSAMSTCSLKHEIFGCFWICVGMLAGSYCAKVTAFRSNLMLYLLSTLTILLINLYQLFNFAFFYAIRGFFIGSILYGGILTWFAFWRKQPRTLLILMLFFSFGTFLSMMIPAKNEEIDILSRIRRDIVEDKKVLLPFSDAVMDNTTSESLNTTEMIKKPEVATGNVQKVKTKTEENAEKQREIEKKKEDSNIVNEVSSTSTTTSTTSTTTTTTTSTTSTPLTNNTPKPAENIATLPQFCPNLSIFLPAKNSDQFLGDSSTLTRNFGVFVVGLFLASFLLCCLPCGIRADSRIRKLESESLVGLGMRLRLSIATIQTLVGFLQQIVHFHSSNDHMLGCLLILITSVLSIFGGDRLGSIGSVYLSTAIFGAGSILSIFWSSEHILVVGLFLIWISLFLTVEIGLHVRCTVQMAYFLIAWIFGRILACFFEMQQAFVEIQGLFLPIIEISIIFLVVYATRLLEKSKRLKEILDNSGSPMTFNSTTNDREGGGGGGEYISLTAQDLNDEEEEDDYEADRSSMDLDFELQQLGLEPVGARN